MASNAHHPLRMTAFIYARISHVAHVAHFLLAWLGWPLALVWWLAMVSANIGWGADVPLLADVYVMVIWSLFGVVVWRTRPDFLPWRKTTIDKKLEAHFGVAAIGPLRHAHDALAAGDAAMWALANAQRAKALAAITSPVWPMVRVRDVRVLAALVLGVVAMYAHQGAMRPYLLVDPLPMMGDGPVRVEAYLVPPDYAGGPALPLEDANSQANVAKKAILRLRVYGTRFAPKLHGPSGWRATLYDSGQSYFEGRYEILRSGRFRLNYFGGRWQADIALSATGAPKLVAPVRVATQDTHIILNLELANDVPLSAVTLRMRPATGPVRWPQKDVALTLEPVDSNKSGVRAYRAQIDMADHPWAGMAVQAHAIVRNQADSVGRSAMFRVTLPDSGLRHPIARGLNAVRIDLLRQSEAPPPLTMPMRHVRARLADMLMAATYMPLPEAVWPKVEALVPFLDAPSTLVRAQLPEKLWALAQAIDHGGQSDAQRALKKALDGLRALTQRPHSAQEWQQALDEAQRALRARLDELAQESGGDSSALDVEGPDGEGLSADDLANMLNALSGQGAADQQAQLNDFEQLMEQLQMGQGAAGSGDGSSGGQANDDILSEDGSGSGQDNLAQAQQALADDTARAASDPQASDPQASDPNKRGNQAETRNQLASRQRRLAANPDTNANARAAMNDAARAIERGDLSGAHAAQMRALAALRAAQNDAGQDPLGRATDPAQGGEQSANGGAGGPEPTIPRQLDPSASRRVRDQLRQRRDAPENSDDDRNLLDRLLSRG